MIFKEMPTRFFDFFLNKPKLTIIGFFLIFIVSLLYTFNNLKVVTSTEKLISEELDFRKKQAELRKEFPSLSNNIVILLSSNNSKLLKKKTEKILAELSQIDEKINFIFSPNYNKFFVNNALLLMDDTSRSDLINKLYESQPFLSEINNSPNLRGFNNLLELSIKHYESKEDLEKNILNRFNKIFGQMRDSLLLNEKVNWKNSLSESPQENLIIFNIKKKTLKDEGFHKTYKLLYNLKEKAKVENIEMSFTGGVVLDYEEANSVVKGATKAGLLSFFIVFILLWIAFRNLLLIFSLLLSLIIGLSITLGLTTLFVGSLNIISVAFAVLFIGISIDFGIQLSLRIFETNNFSLKKIKEKTMRVSSSLLIVAITSMIGFLSFIPTNYTGLSELGIISSFGLIAGFLTNILLLPCLIITFRKYINFEIKRKFLKKYPVLINFLERHSDKNCVFIIFFIIMGTFFSNDIKFDSDPMKLKDQNSQSVILALQLMEKNPSSDYTISVFGEKIDKENLEKLMKSKNIKGVFRLSDLKLSTEEKEEVEYLRFLYSSKPNKEYSSINELERLTRLLLKIKSLKLEPISNNAFDLLASFENNDKDFIQLQDLWFGNFHFLINDITQILQINNFDNIDIPNFFKNRYYSANGLERIEIFPSKDVTKRENLENFIRDVKEIFPDSSGMPIIQFMAGKTVVESFIFAFCFSIIFLFLFTFLIFRNLIFTFFCLIPLFLSLFIIIIIMKIFSLNLNFANMISLPLLFSLGTSYSIYLVKRVKDYKSINKMMKSSTPTAILFSALTTTGSFGTLSFSLHSGTSSMGILLFISMVVAVFSCLIILPFIMKRFRLVF